MSRRYALSPPLAIVHIQRLVVMSAIQERTAVKLTLHVKRVAPMSSGIKKLALASELTLSRDD
jgi:hypothetical protein